MLAFISTSHELFWSNLIISVLDMFTQKKKFPQDFQFRSLQESMGSQGMRANSSHFSPQKTHGLWMDINNALKRYSKSHLSTYHYDSFIQDNTVVFFWRLNFIEPWDIAIWENLESAFLRFNLSPTCTSYVNTCARALSPLFDSWFQMQVMGGSIWWWLKFGPCHSGLSSWLSASPP